MKKKMVAIVFIVLLMMTGVSLVSNVVGAERSQGDFNAELGRRENDRPIISLDGSFHTRTRYFIVSGTAETQNNSGRFKGIFTGNNFLMRLTVRGSQITLIGKCRFDDEHQEFAGIWIGRGIPLRGWITGTFTPAD
jgi:hypothetical protein